jgi:hypothetical protein
MNLKHLGSTLCLLSVSALFTDGAVAQPGAVSSQSDAKAKFANDYNAGHFKDVIADAEMLRKFNALDVQSQLIIGQAYYKAGDYAGCVKYIQENINPATNETAALLLDRCRKS